MGSNPVGTTKLKQFPLGERRTSVTRFSVDNCGGGVPYRYVQFSSEAGMGLKSYKNAKGLEISWFNYNRDHDRGRVLFIR
jgi:hypothetical protein